MKQFEKTVTLKIPAGELAKFDEFLERYRAELGGVDCSRSSMIRKFMREGIERGSNGSGETGGEAA